MAKKAQPDFSGISDAVPKTFKVQGWIGKEIVYVKPSDLQANPLNSTLFKRENEEYFSKLRDDIQSRGILVPLIAKRDNTLLAGHNRLEIAQSLGLKVVPVQYVDTALTKEAEQEFVIKDNLLRRQLSTPERIALYRRLYHDFDARILEEHRGGDRKSAQQQPHNVTGQNNARHTKLTAKQIADDTGQKVTAVKQQIHKYRKEIGNRNGSQNGKAKGKTPTKNIKGISHTFDIKNATSLGKSAQNATANSKKSPEKITLRVCVNLLKECAKKVENVDEETLTHIYKKAKNLMNFLEAKQQG